MSTTQTITGALLAIGLFEGIKGVNWRSVLRVCAPPPPLMCSPDLAWAAVQYAAEPPKRAWCHCAVLPVFTMSPVYSL